MRPHPIIQMTAPEISCLRLVLFRLVEHTLKGRCTGIVVKPEIVLEYSRKMADTFPDIVHLCEWYPNQEGKLGIFNDVISPSYHGSTVYPLSSRRVSEDNLGLRHPNLIYVSISKGSQNHIYSHPHQVSHILPGRYGFFII